MAIWVWIAIKLFAFDPTDLEPQLVLSTAFTTVSGALSAAVGAGTAAALGIKINQEQAKGTALSQAVASGATASPIVIAGILSYLAVGVLLITAWLVKGDASPEIVTSFAIGALAWMGGAFAGVFGASQ